MALTGGRAEARRHVAAVLAIMLGTAFVAVVLLGSATLQSGIESRYAATLRGADVVVSSNSGGLPAGLRAQAAAVPGVTGTEVVLVRALVLADPSGGGPVMGRTLPRGGVSLGVGTLPTAPGDVVVTPELARSRALKVGDRLDVRADPTRRGRPARVAGIAASSNDTPPVGLPIVFAADRDLAAWSGDAAPTELRLSAPGSVEQVRDAVAALPQAAGLNVRTAEQETTEQSRMALAGLRTLSVALLAFAAVAVFVAGLVIANTFAMLVAARVRRIALQRCVGATRGQVRLAVLVEALVVGLVGAVAGIAVGVGVVAVGGRVADSEAFPFAGIALTPVGILVPLALGIVVTLVAALAPARRATVVSPLVALRPEPPSSAGVRRRRVVAGAVLALAGTGALVAGAILPHLVLGIAGGLASFVGVLVLAPVLVPAAGRAFGPLLRRAGPSGELAMENARRNPRRSAATVGALLVGVTLVTMMVVGAESGRRTVEREMARKFAVDAIATAPVSLPDRVIDGLRRNPAVTTVAPVPRSARVTVDGRDLGEVIGMSPQAGATTRFPEFLAGLTDSTVSLPDRAGVAPGTTVTLRVGDRERRLVALPGPYRIDQVVVTDTTLAALDPDPVAGAWLRLREDIDDTKATTVLDQLNRFVTASVPEASVAGPAPARARVFALLDLILQVAIGLSAVAVVIALVGVGNTLGLSVLERTRENGLLRALGLTRRGLRATVGHESLLLGAVALVVGLVLGVGYGVAGVHALLTGTAREIVVGVPAGQLASVAVVALVAAWAASVLPARRAGNTSPCVALAHE